MVSKENGNIFISHEAMKANKDRANSSLIGLSWVPGKKVWKVLATRHNTLHVNRIFGADFDLHTEKPSTTEFMVKNDFEFIVKPYQHQIDSLLDCNQSKFFAYFDEPGLGKTKVLIDDVRSLYPGKVDTVFVLCPKSVIKSWVKEINTNSPTESFVSYWPNLPLGNGTYGIRWYIMNPAALTTKSAMKTRYENQIKSSNDPEEIKRISAKIKHLKIKNDDGMSVASSFLISSTKTMMVIDESTTIANHNSTISKLCDKLGSMVEYRRIMTGDPIPNEPINIYNQINWLDPSTVKHRNFYAFRNRYCVMGGFKNKQIVGYKNKQELSNMLSAYGHRSRTKDVLDMPTQNRYIRDVELSDKTLKLYNEIINKDIVPLFDGKETISANMALTKIVKLEQLCGGTLKDDDGKSHWVSNEKAKELLNLIKEFGDNSVLVWCHFRTEIEMLKDILKDYKVETYHGSTKLEDRQKIVDAFENKEIKILIIQDDAGHLGITLNAATYAVFYSNHRRPIVRNQAERRNWRIGQKHPVFYYDLLSGMIDTTGYNSLITKSIRNYGITDKLTKKELLEIMKPHGNN